MTIEESLPDDVKALIKEHNIHDKLNHFFYQNRDVYDYLKNSNLLQIDTYRNSQIERELIPFINSVYDGKKVTVINNSFHNRDKKTLDGIIEHKPTREYDYVSEKGAKSVRRTTENGVSFRYKESGKPESGETIALWVNTGDKYTTHLYNIDKIELK